MKTALYLSLLSLIIFSSCSSYRSSSIEPDDRYFSLTDARKDQRHLKKLKDETPATAESSSQDPNYKQYKDNVPLDEQSANGGQNIVNNNYYDMDNYYDYMYASRLRRFHQPYNSYSYYNPYYTNMYWYNNNPMSFGTSIYTTYSFYNPYVPWGYNNWSPGWSFGWNNWSGFQMNYGWGYNAWGSPFYYNPWAFNPYGYGMGGFNNGFMHGYQTALFQQNYSNNQMYYNSYDQNSYVSPVVNQPNTGGFGAGANMIKPAPTLAQTLSKEVGSAPISQVKSPGDSKPGTSGKELQQVNPNTATNISGPASAKSEQTQVKSGANQAVGQVNTGGNSEKNGSGQAINQADRYTSIKQAPQGVGTKDGSVGIADQKGKDGLIQNGTPQTQMNAGNYNSIPTQGAAVQRQNLYTQQPGNIANQGIRSNNINQTGISTNKSVQENSQGLSSGRTPQSQIGQQAPARPGNIGQATENQVARPVGQAYKPSYDYNQTLPGNTSQTQIRQQSPVNTGNIARQPEIRQNQGQGDVQYRNYQQAPQTRPNDRIRSVPQNEQPIDRSPSREYNRQQNQSQPFVRPENPAGRQQQQYQNQQVRPSAPSRSFDRAPSNNNFGGSRGNLGGGGGGGQMNRTGTIRR